MLLPNESISTCADEKHSRIGIISILLLLALFILGADVFAEDPNSEDEDGFFDLSIEQLMNVEVTSSARRAQSISRSTRAVYVITAEDIRQAGPVRIEDLFRMVPGMDVFRTKGLVSAVGSRGYTKWNNERMQILLDGRPLYDPYLGGALFYLHPIFLENIERIEVIRGSAGVTWGVNAMNGVINIITKKTADTQGGLVYGAIGEQHLYQDFLRYGGTEGPFSWRGTIGSFYEDGFVKEHDIDSGLLKEDDYGAFLATGRAEWAPSEDTTMVFTGGHQNGWSNNETLQYMNFLWEKRVDEENTLQFRWTESYITRKKMKNYYTSSNSWMYNLADVGSREEMFEIQHNVLFGRHNIVWGADYTQDVYRSRPRNEQPNTIREDFYNDQVSVFVEDEIELADNLWYTIGGRGFYNELTHFDWAGSTALVWEFKPNHFLRTAVSRSFRRPTMWQEFRCGPLKYIGTGGFPDGKILIGEGNDSLDNESQISYEIGYRGQWAKNLSVNVEGYLNKDKDMMAIDKSGTLTEVSPTWPPGWSDTDWYNQWRNTYDVTTYGIETSVEWEPAEWWLLRGFHTYMHQTNRNELTNWRTGETGIILSPKHRVGLTNRFKLDDVTTLNTQLYWTDTATQSLEYIHGEPFWRFDIRLARRIWNDRAEIAIGAMNLLDNAHKEGGYGDWNATPQLTEVPRQFYVQFFCSF